MGRLLCERSCHFRSAKAWVTGSAIRMRLSDNMNCQSSLYALRSPELWLSETQSHERWGREVGGRGQQAFHSSFHPGYTWKSIHRARQLLYY